MRTILVFKPLRRYPTKRIFKKLLKVILVLLIPATLVFSFILTIYIVAWRTGLPGFRGGPQDAFRHTLASAYVARYLGGETVLLFTRLSERNPDSNYDLMDWHNNQIGIRIGLSDAPDLYQAVANAVKNGRENAQDKNMIRWLPQNKWADEFGIRR